jgi:prefoldin subunit 5
MPPYAVDWHVFNECVEQLQVLQSEINELNQHFNSGRAGALDEWSSDAKEVWQSRKDSWTTAATTMKDQARMVQQTAQACREQYQQAAQTGVRLWS